MELWYSLVSLIVVSDQPIDSHIQALLQNLLVSLIVGIPTMVQNIGSVSTLTGKITQHTIQQQGRRSWSEVHGSMSTHI